MNLFKKMMLSLAAVSVMSASAATVPAQKETFVQKHKVAVGVAAGAAGTALVIAAATGIVFLSLASQSLKSYIKCVGGSGR